MEPNEKSNYGIKGLDIADMLCSTGYLPPRHEQDIDRFESIYNGQTFKTESYTINSDAIFDSVITSRANLHYGNKKMPLRINQTQLKAARSIKGKRK